MLQSVVRDCLYLNWALPAAALPPAPAPLRYQLHPFQGEDHVFASAVLFHQEGLHLQGLPRLRLSYPQCNVRLYVLDGDSVPAVLFRSMLMPLWVVPGVRLVSQQLPRRMHEIARSRLGRLSSQTRHLLQVAAVLGRSFRVDDLAEMFDEPPSRLLPPAIKQEIKQILTSWGRA